MRAGCMPRTVNDLYVAFQRHADAYYRRPDGSTTSEADNFRDALKPVLQLYGAVAVADFGRLAGPRVAGAPVSLEERGPSGFESASSSTRRDMVTVSVFECDDPRLDAKNA
jgi:hypothetical protein